MTNKDKIGIIKFILAFLIILAIPQFLSNLIQPIINFFSKSCSEPMCAFIPIFLSLGGIFIIQLFLPIFLSIWIIKNSDNKYLLNLFSSFKLSSLTFLFCIIFDLAFLMLFGRFVDMGAYILFFSLTKNFLPIYIIAIINTIRLKIKKQEHDA